MKTIHKITLGIALAIAATSTCIISAQAKGNIKEMLLSQNVEAISKSESWISKLLWEKEWRDCSSQSWTVQTTYGITSIKGTYEDVEAQCKALYSKYTILYCTNTNALISYCFDGPYFCWANDCR